MNSTHRLFDDRDCKNARRAAGLCSQHLFESCAKENPENTGHGSGPHYMLGLKGQEDEDGHCEMLLQSS